MDIIIKESGVAKPLVYMDTATGTECTLDILQMMGAFTNGTITYNEETEHKVIQKIFETIRETLSAK